MTTKRKNFNLKSCVKKFFTLFFAILFLFNTVYIVTLSAEEKSNGSSEVTKTNNLQNGSFEEGQTWTSAYQQPYQSAVPSWNTTAFQGKIELFRKNNGVYIKGVKLEPSDGLYAAELNADEESTLYQNLKTAPSSVYEWGLDHGARNGADTMALIIGPSQPLNPSKPNKDGRDQLMQMVDWLIANGKTSVKTTAGLGEKIVLYSKKFAESGTFVNNDDNKPFSLTKTSVHTERWDIWILSSKSVSTGTNPWSHFGSNSTEESGNGNSGTGTDIDLSKYYYYSVPSGQTDTLFGFVSVGVYKPAISDVAKQKTYGNFIDNINFSIYHTFSGSSTNHGTGIVQTDKDNVQYEHTVDKNNNVKIFVEDGNKITINAYLPKEGVDEGCRFIGVYLTTQDEYGNPVSKFISLSGNEIIDDGNLTEEEKAGKWVKSTDENGNILYYYDLGSISAAINVHFVFIKNPTITYEPNGGKPYIVDTVPGVNDMEDSENVYTFKPKVTDSGEFYFVPPYVSKAAEGQNDGWKFVGWLLTGDVVSSDEIPEGSNIVNDNMLGSMILPDTHTIACDYEVKSSGEDKFSQYFKIYNGNITLEEKIHYDESDTVIGVSYNSDPEPPLQYANYNNGLTLIAQWLWRQSFIPQKDDGVNVVNSDEFGTVKILGVDESDPNYNAEYTPEGGKSFFATTNESVTVVAIPKEGFGFLGWFDENGNKLTDQNEYSYIETKESVKTYYARFGRHTTQTFIRQREIASGWEAVFDDNVGVLDLYTHTDIIGTEVSSTATPTGDYRFVGWYDSAGMKVPDSMLFDDGRTIKYNTVSDTTYFARFSNRVTQKYIRMVKSGDKWVTSSTVGSLSLYSFNGEIGTQISNSATPAEGYVFIGWYDSDGNPVDPSMTPGRTNTLSYKVKEDATYYAYFDTYYTLTVSKIDGDNSTQDNKVPIPGVEFALYQKDSAGDTTIRYKGNDVTVSEIGRATTELTEDSSKAVVSFEKLLIPGVEYYLVETATLTEYQLPSGPFLIIIDINSDDFTINGLSKKVIEKEVSVELANYRTMNIPITGSDIVGGNFSVIGLTLMLCASTAIITLLFLKKINKNKGERS